MISRHRQDKVKFRSMLTDVFTDLDIDASDAISLEELEQALDREAVVDLFDAMGVGAHDAWTLFKLLDADEDGTVDRTEFLEGCLELKGVAKGFRLAHQGYQLEWLMEQVPKLATQCQTGFSDLSRQMDKLSTRWKNEGNGQRQLPSTRSSPRVTPVSSALTNAPVPSPYSVDDEAV